MKEAVIQIITATTGALGFSIFFRVSEKMYLLQQSAADSAGHFFY